MKPILFNTEMVQAILEGRKTVTRRLLKQPFEIHPNGYITRTRGNERLCPYEPPYLPGDIIYVRETWCNVNKPEYDPEYCYYADAKYSEDYDPSEYKWKPSIHMPKEATRIFLRVKKVRVEKLHDITDKEAKKEGIIAESNNSGLMHKIKFADLWDTTVNKADIAQYGWNANPFVWVIEFEQISKEEAVESDRT